VIFLYRIGITITIDAEELGYCGNRERRSRLSGRRQPDEDRRALT
jgi:hypothetical protein